MPMQKKKEDSLEPSFSVCSQEIEIGLLGSTRSVGSRGFWRFRDT